MTTKRKKDPRVQRTKDAIQSAFKEMVCEVPYEKITVKALTLRAGINRNTFYLHYETVDDVLREIQAKISSEYIALTKNFDYIDDTRKIVESFFTFSEAQDDFYKIITCDSRFDYIRSAMQKKVVNATISRSRKMRKASLAEQNIVRAFNNTTLYLYRQWVEDGRKIPLKKMIALATRLLESGIQGWAEGN